MTHIILAGAMPPPVHGMAAVNAAIHARLQDGGAELSVIDVSAHSLHRSLGMRLSRLPKVLLGLGKLLMSSSFRGGDTLYMSVSGGLGQLYEIGFLVVARLRRMRIYLHYHSFAYLDRRNLVTAVLIRISGPGAVHVTLSPGMAERLKSRYPAARRVVAVSNAVFFTDKAAADGDARRRLGSIGFLSNISAEKGIFEFLDLVQAYEAEGLHLTARIAGPFQDEIIERQVRQRLATLGSAEYLGPLYGPDKEAFLESIDALIFPTRYVNEAEPLALHEALQRGIPVIAYGRGAIPEIVDTSCGLVVEPGSPFVPAAMAKLEAWRSSPEEYQSASRAAVSAFCSILHENLGSWRSLLGEILGASATVNSTDHRMAFAILPVAARCRKLIQILCTGDGKWLNALRHGVGAGTEHVRMLRRLDCKTVIDVGANRGQFALAARRCFPDALLVSFEPLPGPAGVYRSIFAGDPSTILHDAAIGPERSKSLIHISAHDDSSSLLPPTSMQKQLFPGTWEVGSRPVEVAPLDAFVSPQDIVPPALLKLDVQGFELKALMGCASLFDRFRYVYVECSFVELYEKQPLAHEIIRYLDIRGFSLSGIYNVHHDSDGAGVQADFLFTASAEMAN